jgi:DNA polymerase-1
MTKNRKKILIIDGHGLVHRAYHALPPMTSPAGLPVNAAYGVTSMVLKLLQEQQPDYACVAFDRPGESERKKSFVAYKAQREQKTEDFYQQIPFIEESLAALGVKAIESKVPGYEADDVIGSIVAKINQQQPDVDCLIISGDQDILQLVNEQVKVLSFIKGMSQTIVYDQKAVKNRYGFSPPQLIDFKALRGDPSDNIPGVKGIGEKTASQLVSEFGTLDNIYKKLEQSQLTTRQKQLLSDQKADAYLSYELVTIKKDLITTFSLADCQWQGPKLAQAMKVFQKYGFKSLLDRLTKGFKKTLEQIGSPVMDLDAAINMQAKVTDKQSANQPKIDYQLVNKQTQLNKLLAELKNIKQLVIDTETDSLNTTSAKLLGISFCWQPGRAYYLDCRALPDAIKLLQPLLLNLPIIGHNLKFDLKILQLAGLELNNVANDSLLSAYVAFGSDRNLSLDALVFSELGYQMQPIEDLIGQKGKTQINLSAVATEKVGWYSCEDADFTLRLANKLNENLTSTDKKILNEFEIPLIKVLQAMETEGILVDKKYLVELQKNFESELANLREKIIKLSGEDFNINSTQQLADILFNKLKISSVNIKKTKTGISTAANELEKLNDVHPIIPLISQYREYNKLQNTYAERLPEQLDKNSRVHTNFNQTITATGRLSSSDPNLQNIPVRTPLGKKIRNAFLALPDQVLISADYSQIELRLAAHLADEDAMISAFANKADIHRDTASKIFKLPSEKITDEQRSLAKTINFGILYGLSAFGLAQRVKIDRQQAKAFIDEYFLAFPKLANWRDKQIETAREQGFAQTMFGRKRILANINAGSPQLRAAAERMAINMPVQGACADIIKLAMIKLHKELPKKFPQAKMLIQVHDELVFSCPKDQVKTICKFITDIMENVCQLKVPIEVNIGFGQRWSDC